MPKGLMRDFSDLSTQVGGGKGCGLSFAWGVSGWLKVEVGAGETEDIALAQR